MILHNKPMWIAWCIMGFFLTVPTAAWLKKKWRARWTVIRKNELDALRAEVARLNEELKRKDEQ